MHWVECAVFFLKILFFYKLLFEYTEGFLEPLGIEKPKSFVDVTERSSVKSTNDE